MKNKILFTEQSNLRRRQRKRVLEILASTPIELVVGNSETPVIFTAYATRGLLKPIKLVPANDYDFLRLISPVKTALGTDEQRMSYVLSKYPQMCTIGYYFDGKLPPRLCISPTNMRTYQFYIEVPVQKLVDSDGTTFFNF